MSVEPLGLSECAGCHRLIRWFVSGKSGKDMPFDAVPSEAGTFRLERNPDPENRRPLALFVPPRERVGKLWVAHHATCPQAERFRRPPVGGHTPSERRLAEMRLQAAEIEAERLADELIDLTRSHQRGRFPSYLECRLEWPAFVAAHPTVDRRVLRLVGAAALRKIHPKEAAAGDRTMAPEPQGKTA